MRIPGNFLAFHSSVTRLHLTIPGTSSSSASASCGSSSSTFPVRGRRRKGRDAAPASHSPQRRIISLIYPSMDFISVAMSKSAGAKSVPATLFQFGSFRPQLPVILKPHIRSSLHGTPGKDLWDNLSASLFRFSSSSPFIHSFLGDSGDEEVEKRRSNSPPG